VKQLILMTQTKPLKEKKDDKTKTFVELEKKLVKVKKSLDEYFGL
jgi:hypothetical protein